MSPVVNEDVRKALLVLADERQELREALAVAQKAVDANTEAIATLLPGKLGGSRSSKVSDEVKVVVKRDLLYKVDAMKVREVCPEYPPIKTVVTDKVDVKGYKWYEANNAEMFKKIAEHVTVTPAKTAVELVVKAAK